MKMKVTFLIVHLIGIMACTYGQSGSLIKETPVQIKNWGMKTYAFAEEVWTQVKGQMIAKLGKNKFDSIKFYSDNANIPVALAAWDGDRKVPNEEYNKRMNALRVYKVTDFIYQYDGKDLNYTVLSVPFQPLYWDSTAKWDTVYFTIKSEAVQQKTFATQP
jgi:hypothetical protein